MSESTISRVESKLDKLTNDITEIKVCVAKTEEHLKTINGTIVKQENKFFDMGKRLGMVEQKMWLAYGGITVIAILGSLKVIGVW